ncbi:MAG: DUF1028 domain-containing protein [Planctomycetota bacterium]|nr:DUF1028 domain-containing protein [Planctomycetota bacterium]
MKLPESPPRFLRRLAVAALALSLVAAPLGATWSVVVINMKTGEVVVASATCLEDFLLEKNLAVLSVGIGGGVSQGVIDHGAIHRKIIWEGLNNGDSPDQIITTLVTTGSGVNARQWGVVNFPDAPATWSGFALGDAFHGVAGIDGDLRYAIQGNVITGRQVVLAAEQALLQHEGDLSEKVMAAMEAARSMGGDGRCSCTTGGPTACGVPPPGFTKSAHVAFIVLARIGDTQGPCTYGVGCASGAYYLNLEISGDASDPDPVLELEEQYARWRAGLRGRPDHILSTVEPGATSLVADGVTSTDVTVQLVDLNGAPLATGGAQVSVALEGGGTPFAAPGPVTDNGDGSYTFLLTAGTLAGTDTFVITADDGVVEVTLYPLLEIAVDPVTPLHVGVETVSASSGGAAPFVLNLGAGAAGDLYVVVGGLSGTSPGFDFGGGVILPINPDWFTTATLELAGGPFLPGTIGFLDAGGRAEAAFAPTPGLLAGLVGLHVDWAAVDYTGPLVVTNPVGFDIAP